MVIHVTATLENNTSYKMYICSLRDIEEIMEEIMNMDISTLLDEDSTSYCETENPFLLSSIYVN